MSTKRDFGFIGTDKEDEDDFFVPAEEINGALDGDTVEFSVIKGRGGRRTSARVEKIVERGITFVVGTFEAEGKFGFVISDNLKFDRDIFIPEDKTKGAEDGQKVLVDIASYGGERRPPVGEVREVIGFESETGCDVMCVARSAGVPMEFP
ncbi:MAG: cold shock domain-containing protein [Eubacterium sp.]|nr:cold shock domain-containing protein [Eubacterium sp.]